MTDIPDDLAAAAAAHEADVEALADLDDDQLDYLARLDEVYDPVTAGVENTRCV